MQSGLRGGRAEHGQDLGHDGVQLLGEVVERAELENLWAKTKRIDAEA